MEELITGILRHRGARLDPTPGLLGTASIRPLGRISEPPIGLRNGPARLHTMIWHAPDGWTVLDRVELDRWIIDAPLGNHWLISERPLAKSLIPPERDGLQTEIWGPEELSSWIGEAVLSGEIKTSLGFQDVENKSVPQEVEEIRLESAWFNTLQTEVATFQPTIDLEVWLERNPLKGVRPTAVLVEGRVWSVQGILRGPDDSTERSWWSVLEVPQFGSFRIIEDPVFLNHRPRLRILPSPGWMEEAIVRQNIERVTETRRPYSPREDVAVRIQGRWKLDPSSAEIEFGMVLIPAWVLESPSAKTDLLDATTGTLHTFSSEIR